MPVITKNQLTALLVSLAILVAQQQHRSTEPPNTGAIEGIVLDENDALVQNALITVQPEGTSLIGKMPAATSAPGGKFVVKGVPTGRAFLFAGNRKDGYPDTQFAVFASKDIALVRVLVEPGKTTKNIILHMPLKGGRIVGRIINSVTGAPILTARIHLFQASDPSRDISTSPTLGAEFEFVVPPLAYGMEVNAPHYKSWRLGQATGPATNYTIKVAPGSTDHLIVKLEPE